MIKVYLVLYIRMHTYVTIAFSYRYWNGARCEVYDAGFPGGIGQDVTVETTTLEPLDNQRQLCISAGCPEKAADGQCDRECNS